MKEILPIQAPYLGYTQKARPHPGMSASHCHDELELNLVLKGHASYLLDSRRYMLDVHTLVWLFPGQEHILLECSQDFEMWVIVFRPELVTKICKAPGYHLLREKDPAGYFCKRIGTRDSQQIDQLLTDMSHGHDATLFNAGLAYTLPLAWSVYSTTTEIPPSADVHPAVENAIHLLNKNSFCDDLTALAEHAGLSPARLSRLFKEQIGVSMVHFKNRLRVERFLKLYHKGRRKNIMDTALDAGFGSYPQFHREFTRIMGCSPAKFRRKHTTDS
jgi:AraC-like DNA-binding protein